MRFVLDCSVSVPWYLDDERTRYSEHVLNLLPDHEAVVPELWRVVFSNAILTAHRRRRISVERFGEILRQAEGLGLIVDTYPVPAAALSALALRYDLTAYDAVYLDLAQRLSLPLATQDKALEKAAPRAGVTILK